VFSIYHSPLLGENPRCCPPPPLPPPLSYPNPSIPPPPLPLCSIVRWIFAMAVYYYNICMHASMPLRLYNIISDSIIAIKEYAVIIVGEFSI
jgi:hypothetical protein